MISRFEEKNRAKQGARMKRLMMSMFLIVNLFLWNTPVATAQFPEAGVQKLEVPVQAPDFALEVLGGGKISLRELSGKVIVLNFFTSWCPVCQEEFLSFDKLSKEFKDRDIVFLKVAVKAKGKDLLRYRKFAPILMDDDGSVAKTYGFGAGHHETFFINREGKIVGKTFTEKDWASQSVRNLIHYLLAD
jgi:peroxiredoxin